MDRQQVITTLESLAKSVDPLAAGALNSAIELLKETPRPRNPNLPAAGTAWSKEEDARLCTEHDAGLTVAQMALQHGRTSSAITLRLVKLGKIDPAAVKTRERGASPRP